MLLSNPPRHRVQRFQAIDAALFSAVRADRSRSVMGTGIRVGLTRRARHGLLKRVNVSVTLIVIVDVDRILL